MTELQPPPIRKLDETVVNRIAAGEVIQRPANAVKELLENSLDAKSTNIQITVKNGGLKLLQIQDNGTGIRKDDLKIVCERFTTSKLVKFEDLNTIASFGFRGEALASISHVAHLSITTKTFSESCAYKGIYEDGKLLESIKPCAGNQGTLITIEDLFYNVPTRRNALKNVNEEHIKVAEVVSRYAIHNPLVGFTLRKQGESLAEIRTNHNSTHVDNIRTIYGSSIAGSLEEIETNDNALTFSMKGYITNANFSVKKQIFLLFINNRLVNCADLRKKLEHVYELYLPKGTHSFMYLSLTLDPKTVDVNVHPTKYEVHFLHEEAIIDKIKSAIESKLLGCNAARTYYTQSKLPVSVVSVSSGLTASERSRSIAPNYQVRTDPTEQKLDKYFSSSSIVTQVTEPDCSESRRIMRLKSVLDMRKEIEDNVSEPLKEILRNYTFVGVSCPAWTLIQHKTELYACNMTKLLYETFYQLIIHNFGNVDAIKFTQPLNIRQLIRIGLKYSDSIDEQNDEKADKAAEALYSHKEMLNDYFTMEIDSDCNLITIPLLLDNYLPEMEELPMYLWRLATEIDWTSERLCFQGFCELTAKFYSQHYWKDRSDSMTSSLTNDEKRESGWYWTVEHVLLPCIRKNLLPSKSLEEQRAILQLDKLPQLYSEFDRC